MKVVINRDYGWFGTCVYSDYKDFVANFEGDRTNPQLITFVEDYPNESGDLTIATLPNDVTDYVIIERDGFEYIVYSLNGLLYVHYGDEDGIWKTDKNEAI